MAVPRTDKLMTNPVFDFIRDFNLLMFSVTFLYLRFSDMFRWYKKATLDINGLMIAKIRYTESYLEDIKHLRWNFSGK